MSEVPSSVVSLTALDLAVWVGASSHIEFLLVGRKAVLMTFAIATRSRYTSGPLTQPFLVC